MIPARPRRLAPPSPFGALLKRVGADVSPPRPRQRTTEENADHLALVRQCPCLHCGMEPCEAAHVRLSSAAFGKASGLGKKPGPEWTLPLCAEHHRLSRGAQHNQGEARFWADLGINPLLVCQWLYAQSGDLVAMRAVVFVAIAERGRT